MCTRFTPETRVRKLLLGLTSSNFARTQWHRRALRTGRDTDRDMHEQRCLPHLRYCCCCSEKEVIVSVPSPFAQNCPPTANAAGIAVYLVAHFKRSICQPLHFCSVRAMIRPSSPLQGLIFTRFTISSPHSLLSTMLTPLTAASDTFGAFHNAKRGWGDREV